MLVSFFEELICVHHLADKGLYSQSCDFSSSHVRMWELDHRERRRIDAFKLRSWRKLLKVTLTARRSNQSIWKEINPEYSLEGLMLNLQYFGHLMWRADSLKNTLRLGKIEGRRRREWQRIRWLDGIIDSRDKSLSNLWEMVKDRQACSVSWWVLLFEALATQSCLWPFWARLCLSREVHPCALQALPCSPGSFPGRYIRAVAKGLKFCLGKTGSSAPESAPRWGSKPAGVTTAWSLWWLLSGAAAHRRGVLPFTQPALNTEWISSLCLELCWAPPVETWTNPGPAFQVEFLGEINVMMKLHPAESWGAQGETFTGQVIFHLDLDIWPRREEKGHCRRKQKHWHVRARSLYFLQKEKQMGGWREELQGGVAGAWVGLGVLSWSSLLRFPWPPFLFHLVHLGFWTPSATHPHTHFIPLRPSQIT